MHADYNFCALKDREIREQVLSERMAGSRRLALGTSRGPSLREPGWRVVSSRWRSPRIGKRPLERGLGGAGSEGTLMRRNSSGGAAGHEGCVLSSLSGTSHVARAEGASQKRERGHER